jgi:hypothetical protein
MRFIKPLSILLLPFCLAFIGHAQQVDPSYQINWNSAWTCNVNGCPVQNTPVGAQSVNQPSGTTLSINSLNNALAVGTTGYSSISSAITAAGSTGSVDIPANYQPGTQDNFFANPYGLFIGDHRPLSLSATPKNEIHASTFGAVCNSGVATGTGGFTTDTIAIRAALAAQYVYNLTTAAVQSSEVLLPQGSCMINGTLSMTGFHGSLVGEGSDSTYLIGYYPLWVGTSNYDVLDIVATGTNAAGASIGIRRVSNMAIVGEGNSSIPNSMGIRIYNTSNNYSVDYALANIDFTGLLVAQFDTCIQAEDLINSEFQFNKIQNCRNGLNFFGDVENNYVAHNTIDSGSLTFTNTPGNTTAYLSQQNTKYGGGSEQPQGVYFHDNSVENWNIGAWDQECIDCSFDYNQFDEISNIDFEILENGCGGYGIWVKENTFGMNSNTATGLFVACIADGSTATTAANLGFWADGNHFQLDGYPTVQASSNVGILFDAVEPFTQAHVTGNQFMGMSTGILVNNNLTNSVITDNFANGALNYIVNLAGASSLVHTHTIVDRNFDSFDSIPAVNVGTSSGAVILYNCTPSGCTTPTYPTLSVGNGFTGTKTAGSCVLAIAGGIITGVTGC